MVGCINHPLNEFQQPSKQDLNTGESNNIIKDVVLS